jgi:hypothetical protein
VYKNSFDVYLVGTTDMTVHWGNDLSYVFTYNSMNGTYTAPTGIFETLVKNGDNTYTLTTKDQVKYNFNTSLRLATIQDGHDNTITIGYSGNNVTTYTWNAKNQVTQVTNDLGHKVVYTYDTNNLDCLKIEYKTKTTRF